jgi:hypothetical protein
MSGLGRVSSRVVRNLDGRKIILGHFLPVFSQLEEVMGIRLTGAGGKGSSET